MNIKIKLGDGAVLPKYAKSGDAAMDLTATSKKEVGSQVIYGTGIFLEIPEGYVGLVFPRSSICKTNLELSNGVGVIDSGYRGEIKAIFNILGNEHPIYQVGERICQLLILPYPTITFVQDDELSETERGSGGFGSTGMV